MNVFKRTVCIFRKHDRVRHITKGEYIGFKAFRATDWVDTCRRCGKVLEVGPTGTGL